jgi:regulator of protease activity HflC (stomatin/prohibitin superfamily)
VKVTRVDVKNINPPEDVRITMEKQMTAERNRRALILQAEGDNKRQSRAPKAKNKLRSHDRKAKSNRRFCKPKAQRKPSESGGSGRTGNRANR